jgi:formylmethanofuran dehydrogenase subunit C
MNALTFKLKVTLKQRLDVSPLIPERLKGQSLSEINQISLHLGNRVVSAGSVFEVSGEDAESLVFEGQTGKLDRLGDGMTAGSILVRGDVGSYAGIHLKGGAIRIQGNADAFLGCEMKAGTIELSGSAGDFVGGALPGSRRGMAGGFIMIRGDVGARAGEQMRRGVLLIEGNAGMYLGSRMVAGTIGVLGSVGSHLGYAMSRGTVLLARRPVELSETFSDCGTHTLSFLPLLLSSFKRFETPFSDMVTHFARVRRFAGDLCSQGKGEILIAEGN